jgi:hypothetical protein
LTSVQIVGLLSLTVITGCASPVFQSRVATTVRQTDTRQIVRAESDDLNDLVRATEDKPELENPAKKERKQDEQCDASNDDPCNDESDSFSQQLVILAISAPFAIPRFLSGDDWDHNTSFPDYPYADGAPGSLIRNSETQGRKQNWMGTLQGITVQDGRGIARYGGRLLLDSESRFGLDTETNFWTQSRTLGNQEQLWTGDANIVYRFAESEHFQWRAGAGMNWLAYRGYNKEGFNFTYGVEWFPAKPWTVSSVLDIGTLGSGTLVHNRTTVGVMLGPLEAFAGYDYFAVDKAHFQGPVAGLGYRF